MTQQELEDYGYLPATCPVCGSQADQCPDRDKEDSDERTA